MSFSRSHNWRTAGSGHGPGLPGANIKVFSRALCPLLEAGLGMGESKQELPNFTILLNCAEHWKQMSPRTGSKDGETDTGHQFVTSMVHTKGRHSKDL